MRFSSCLAFSAISTASLVVAQEQEYILPYTLICRGEDSTSAVDCGSGFCCRKSAQCQNPDRNGIVKCSDGTIALPYNLGLAPSLADVLETASPSAYTSILAQITGNSRIPGELLERITGTAGPSESSSNAASANLPGPSTSLGPIFAILGVWGIAAAGGAAWVFVH